MQLLDAPECLILSMMRFAFDKKAQTRTKLMARIPIQDRIIVPIHRDGTRLLPFRPLLSNGAKLDFVYLIATVPGRHSGDQVHEVKKNAAPLFFFN